MKREYHLYYYCLAVVFFAHAISLWGHRSRMAATQRSSQAKNYTISLRQKSSKLEKKETKKKPPKRSKKKKPAPKKQQQEIAKKAFPSRNLPTPVAEYLVSSMPTLKREYSIKYPERARQLGIEGTVVLDILIDDQGRVRDAKILEGLFDEIDRAALLAIKSYLFSPATMEGKAVAVRVRYGISFELENN